MIMVQAGRLQLRRMRPVTDAVVTAFRHEMGLAERTKKAHILPTVRRNEIVILAYNGAQPIDIAGPLQAAHPLPHVENLGVVFLDLDDPSFGEVEYDHAGAGGTEARCPATAGPLHHRARPAA